MSREIKVGDFVRVKKNLFVGPGEQYLKEKENVLGIVDQILPTTDGSKSIYMVRFRDDTWGYYGNEIKLDET